MLRPMWIPAVIILALAAFTAPSRADSTGLSVSATIVSKHNCRFSSTAAALPFGSLNPLIQSDVLRSTTVEFVCSGNPHLPVYFAIAENGGLHRSGGSNRMRHADGSLAGASAFIPYTLSLSPSSGSVGHNARQLLTITGTVAGSAYRSAPAGSYADTVTITITP